MQSEPNHIHDPRAVSPWETDSRLLAKPPGRGLDLVLMVLCLLPAMGIMVAVATINAVVFRDPRRVFFRQQRVGLDGKTFPLLKFRTMRDDLGPDGRTLSDQERVTRFGRWLRNTHLDELPQLWNIVRGDMSFLGPRPEMLSAHAYACKHIPGFEARLAIRPGITGLAQITQGYALVELESYERKLAIDLAYIQRKSLALDARILVGTAVWMLRGRGWRWNDPTETQRSAGHQEAQPERTDERRAA